MLDPGLPVYIVDTHALYWYRTNPSRLGPAADAVFRLADAGGAHIIVPAIVIAELYYLTQKFGPPASTSAMLEDINNSREFVFSELGQRQLKTMEQVEGVSEMHDRLIAAEALAHHAPLISKDEVLRGIAALDVIW
jgi:PIN domain nuclease of toxin-antitoxin system